MPSVSSVVISSGHGKLVRGASGILDEVDEARKVVERLALELEERGIEVRVFHDDVSTTQNENLNRIVNYHNSQPDHDLDVSVHFNAFEQTASPRGVEVLYVTQQKAAARISAAIASVGFIDRGPKQNNDLFFLNNTEMPAVLIEVCFVDSQADADIYRANFDAICEAIADLVGEGVETQPPPPEPLFYAKGKCSHFGGPGDTTGITASEDLAFFEDEDDMRKAPQLFLPYQPDGTTGMARRLNPCVHYVACRWDYDKTPHEMLLDGVAMVRSVKDHDKMLTAFPADWGPNENTGRVADLSPGLMQDLGLTTDDEVEVVFPWEQE